MGPKITEGKRKGLQAVTDSRGVLCGRATWQDGVPVFVKQGAKALEEWLLKEGVQNIENVNRRLGAAHSWCSAPSETAAVLARRKGKGRP